MCAEGRPDAMPAGTRILRGQTCDAYLVRENVGQRGYAVVIWRGSHVADPTELSDDDAGVYFAEVLRVGRAIEQHYRPIKLNFEMLGNSLPHLHTHVVPRYLDDGEPGHPARFMRTDFRGTALPAQQYDDDVRALRRLLGYQ